MSSGAHAFRFSLATMFGAVLFAAFGTAAVRFASPLWAGLTMTLTVPLLFAAILGALFRLGQARAFWAGMAVCGWGYLLVVLAPWFETGLGQQLPTTYVLNHVHGQKKLTFAASDGGGGQIPGNRPGMPGDPIGYSGTGFTTISVDPDLALVLRTGHALFALLFGFIGGVTAKWFYLTRAPRENEAGQG